MYDSKPAAEMIKYRQQYKGVQIMCDFRVCNACDMMVIHVYISDAQT